MEKKTLKEKWTEALPVFASIFFMIAIIFLVVWGFNKFADYLSRPDPRTPEQIMIDRYKQCLGYTDIRGVVNCKNYIIDLSPHSALIVN